MPFFPICCRFRSASEIGSAAAVPARFGPRPATALALALALGSGAIALGISSPAIARPAGAARLAQAGLDPADAAFRREDYAAAADLYWQALDTLPPGDSEAIARVLNPLSQSLMKLGDDRAALPVLERLLAIEGASPPLLVRIGLARFRLGEAAAAEEPTSRAIAAWETLRSGSDLDDLDKVTLLEQQSYAYRLMQRILIAQGKTDAALEWAERGRARALVEQLVRQSAGEADAAPPDLAQMKAIARSRNLTLVVYSVLGREAKILGNELPDDSILAIWAIAPDGTVAFEQVDLQATGDESLLDLVQAARSAITSPLPRDAVGPLQALHRLAIAPIARHLPADPERPVAFVLQGSLYLLPFAALQDAAGNYLVERHAIGTVPSVQALALATTQPARATGPALVVGNPLEMPAVPAGPDRQLLPLAPLPGAESEAAAIARMLGVEPLLNERATRAAVLARAGDASVLHFATHGLLDLDADLNEFGLPRDPDAPTARAGGVNVTPGGVIIGPGVTINGVDAGIALAGEGVVRPSVPGILALAATGTDDGLLRAPDIARLNLGARLAVLSACDTGRGRITGDGVVGLSRAFVAAGVPSVVASLWKVPDEPTEFLMVRFYDRWQATGNVAASLRVAMLDAMAEYPAPRNWAAFTAIGALE